MGHAIFLMIKLFCCLVVLATLIAVWRHRTGDNQQDARNRSLILSVLVALLAVDITMLIDSL